MYCKNCGEKLPEEARFCTACGAPVRAGAEDAGTGQEAEKNMGEAEPQEKAEAERPGKQGGKRDGLFSGIWNHPVLNRIAIKFGYILDVLLGLCCIFLAAVFFSGGSVLFGLVFLVAGVVNVILGVKDFFVRKSQTELTKETPQSLNRKKRNLVISMFAAVIGVCFLNVTGGGVYANVKSVSFDNFGTQTVGEVVDAQVKNAEWSQEKLDGKSSLVRVEGYCPQYSGKIRITFFYEEIGGGSCEVSLQKIEFPDSGEQYDDIFNAGMIWASLYEEDE